MPNTTVCPLAKKCGGCQLQNLSYPEQLHLKQATAIRLLGRFGHVEEILGMDDPYHYRNKVQAAFGVNRQGQIISGVYQSASHRIVPVSDCLIEDKVADRIIVTIRKLLKSFKIRPYDEDTGRGTLRHVLVLPGKRNFVRALLQQHPDITTVVQNINAGQTSLVLGAHSEVLYGPGYIRELLEHRAFWLYLLVDEAEKRGLDPEEFASAAITRCGISQGTDLQKKSGTKSLKGLRKTLFTRAARWVFEMDLVENTDDTLYLDFHYCPLVKAWQKAGCSDEEIARLCDIAMCGDHGIGSCFDARLELPKAIAKGDDVCALRYIKSNK